jgi:hypothetical protein
MTDTGKVIKTYWGADNQSYYARIQYVPREGKTQLDIQDDGQVVLYASPVFASDIKWLKTKLFRFVDEFLSPLAADEYVRVTPHKEDYEYLSNGTHRGSFDHSGGSFGRDADVSEDGLSVAKSPEFPTAYAYYVTGECIGQGTDGEPLLSMSSVRPTSKLMTYKQLRSNYERRQVKRIKQLGLTQEDVKALHLGMLVKE